MLNWADIRLLYARELRSALRERNIVVNSILLPIFLYPILLWLIYTGISFVGGQTQGFSSRIVLRGLPAQHALLRAELERDQQIELKDSAYPDSDIREGKVDLLVEVLTAQGAAASLPENFRVRLTFDNSKDRSSIARDRLTEKIRRYRDYYLDAEAKKLGLSSSQLQQYWVEERNVATSRQMGQFVLGLILPLFLIMMLSVGCIYPAIDSTAGEREKSTWETLMTTATPRENIVVAKYLYVATMASTAGILNLIAMVFSMKSAMAPLLRGQSEVFTFQLPLKSIPLILAVTILLALFVSAGMMILASFARTFKEGQSMVSPFYIALFLPVLFINVPGLELTPKLALIPVVNVAMVFREAVAGVYRWPLIGITLCVEVVCVALCLKLATLILRHEDFMLGTYGGNFGKFLKERLLAKKALSGGEPK
jgi:sodium transport system permease protein